MQYKINNIQKFVNKKIGESLQSSGLDFSMPQVNLKFNIRVDHIRPQASVDSDRFLHQIRLSRPVCKNNHNKLK